MGNIIECTKTTSKSTTVTFKEGGHVDSTEGRNIYAVHTDVTDRPNYSQTRVYRGWKKQKAVRPVISIDKCVDRVTPNMCRR